MLEKSQIFAKSKSSIDLKAHYFCMHLLGMLGGEDAYNKV